MKKEAKEMEALPKRPEGSSDDPVRSSFLKKWDRYPFFLERKSMEISKRIEKAQICSIRADHHALSLFDPLLSSISNANYLISGKDRFDKIIAEKEIDDKTAFGKEASEAQGPSL